MNNVVEQLSHGALAQAGMLNQSNMLAASELMTQVSESDIETIRVLFTDQHGVLRGKTIVASAFASIFLSGVNVPSTLLFKDSSHRTVFPVWNDDGDTTIDVIAGAGDILLVPDASTFRILPWSPHSAWILCDTVFKSGEPIPYAPRTILETSIKKLSAKNISMVVGLEVEFHIFELINSKLSHADATMPGQPPITRNLTQGYQLLTESRYSELETIMDELRRNCETMKLPLHSMEVEFGPSQFEFTFRHGDVLTQADNMMMFRALVKEVCARRSLHATFMCRPKIVNGASSGWHLHQSLVDSTTGRNLLMPVADNLLTPIASQWMGGLLSHAAESCLLTTPTVNGIQALPALSAGT